MVKETEFYDRLGVSPDSDESTIKKAFYKGAQKWHPDKNKEPGADEKFKEINEAYEVLSDKEKRKMYDQYGKEGLSESGFHASDPFDIFGQMFGGRGFFGGGGRKPSGPKRTKDVQHALRLTLADLYKGITKKVKVQRNILCTKCSGKGSLKEGAVVKCGTCNGSGMKVEVSRIGNMITQRQAVCDKCHGEGEIINEKDACELCKGKKVTTESKILNIEVQRGSKWGEAIPFYGESDQAPDCTTGDLIFVLQPKEDETTTPFKRVGNDLYLDYKIPLIEALTGTQFTITHLDDRKVTLTYSSIISPGMVLKVPEQGMPLRGHPGDCGDLYVKFEVEFPTKISDKEKQALLATFPKKKDEKHHEKHHDKHHKKIEKIKMVKPKEGEGIGKETRAGGRGHYHTDPMDEDEGTENVQTCTQQ